MSKKFPLPQAEGFSQVYQKGSNLIGIAVHLEPPVQRCLASFWRFAVRTDYHLLPPFSATGLHHRSYVFRPQYAGASPFTMAERSVAEWVQIPDNLSGWPWPRAVNPHMEECSAASKDWLQQFNVFSPETQAAFSRCKFGILIRQKFHSRAVTYTCRSSRVIGIPKTEQRYAVFNLSDGGRVGCDPMNLFFVFDEKSDVSDAYETRHQANCIMDALNNPYKPRPP